MRRLFLFFCFISLVFSVSATAQAAECQIYVKDKGIGCLGKKDKWNNKIASDFMTLDEAKAAVYRKISYNCGGTMGPYTGIATNTCGYDDGDEWPHTEEHRCEDHTGKNTFVSFKSCKVYAYNDSMDDEYGNTTCFSNGSVPCPYTYCDVESGDYIWDSSTKKCKENTSCPAEQYKDGASCYACPTGCSACTSASVCTACADGYTLSGNSCIKKETYTYHLNDKKGEYDHFTLTETQSTRQTYVSSTLRSHNLICSIDDSAKEVVCACSNTGTMIRGNNFTTQQRCEEWVNSGPYFCSKPFSSDYACQYAATACPANCKKCTSTSDPCECKNGYTWNSTEKKCLPNGPHPVSCPSPLVYSDDGRCCILE